MKISVECELNRQWIYDEEEDDIVGETNFVVPMDWLKNLFDNHYKEEFDEFELFLDVYSPEVEGEFIYQQAIKDNVLIEDIGVVMY